MKRSQQVQVKILLSMCIYFNNAICIVQAICCTVTIHFATHLIGPASQEQPRRRKNSQEPRELQITPLHRALVDAGMRVHNLVATNNV